MKTLLSLSLIGALSLGHATPGTLLARLIARNWDEVATIVVQALGRGGALPDNIRSMRVVFRSVLRESDRSDAQIISRIRSIVVVENPELADKVGLLLRKTDEQLLELDASDRVALNDMTNILAHHVQREGHYPLCEEGCARIAGGKVVATAEEIKGDVTIQNVAGNIHDSMVRRYAQFLGGEVENYNVPLARALQELQRTDEMKKKIEQGLFKVGDDPMALFKNIEQRLLALGKNEQLKMLHNLHGWTLALSSATPEDAARKEIFDAVLRFNLSPNENGVRDILSNRQLWDIAVGQDQNSWSGWANVFRQVNEELPNGTLQEKRKLFEDKMEALARAKGEQGMRDWEEVKRNNFCGLFGP